MYAYMHEIHTGTDSKYAMVNYIHVFSFLTLMFRYALRRCWSSYRKNTVVARLGGFWMLSCPIFLDGFKRVLYRAIVGEGMYTTIGE